MTLPAPRRQPGVGHLGRWGIDPLALLEEGARLGPVFELRLWRRTIVGYSPAWNRFVLGDLDTFRSRGSMSGLSPHLGAGVVRLDAPQHRARRHELNPPFARRSLDEVVVQVRDTINGLLPVGDFDAVEWTSRLMRAVLSRTFFDDDIDPVLLAQFLRPLDRPLPWPFLPRPVLFRRMNRALRHRIATAPRGSLAAAFRDIDGGVDELRVALSAGYDTTAHTLAWLLAHVAQEPTLLNADRSAVIDEVLRLYPAGWLGSRRVAADTSFAGVAIPRGTLVLYSPYLTHRDPGLWPNPLTFDPTRFTDPTPAWGFIPFAAGERSCLGRPFARIVLDAMLTALAGSELSFLGGDLQPAAGITLRPGGELVLHREPLPVPAEVSR
jgi:cytochrome P450